MSLTCVSSLPHDQSLTFHFQVELGINARATASDIRQDAANNHPIISYVRPDISNVEVIVPDVPSDVSDTNPIVSGVRTDAANTHTVVSDVRRNKLKNYEGVDCKNQAASAIRILPVTE